MDDISDDNSDGEVDYGDDKNNDRQSKIGVGGLEKLLNKQSVLEGTSFQISSEEDIELDNT